ncbi:MAG: DUF4148 domain-containing protein [Tepidimonas sp.]|nr:DUF4148 domain-containing protein [Tepidimonas sp.]
MNRFAVRTLIATSLLAATAAASAASFPVASGEFSAIDMVAPDGAQVVRATRNAANSEGRSRDEVKAELEAARCRGELPFDGETGRTYREVFPGRYPLPGCR